MTEPTGETREIPMTQLKNWSASNDMTEDQAKSFLRKSGAVYNRGGIVFVNKSKARDWIFLCDKRAVAVASKRAADQKETAKTQRIPGVKPFVPRCDVKLFWDMGSVERARFNGAKTDDDIKGIFEDNIAVAPVELQFLLACYKRKMGRFKGTFSEFIELN